MALKKEEKFDISKFKFGKDGLISVVVQDYESGEVLMLDYMNKEAVEKTFETGYAHYFNKTKKAVVKFGDALGNTQKIVTAFLGNEQDSLLLKVKQKGNACAADNAYSCYSQQILGEYNDIGGEMFGRLQRIIADYKKNPEEGAYTSFLFVRGVDRIAKKVGEEAVELVIAAKNEEKVCVISEAADVLYHMMVLLNVKDVKVSEVCAELCKRNR
ncbi:MAG: bifunctional phosphoribosyl-AMP cyclohydrolase/phosphoribosyl-ATP diphosphatase HisIE [Clostridiales bacterium]|nr:bifunctional phosphoribosyl-AMP cyclohydrolase/phosphoribosyl-ATP diphosphatase HisIE [Clostridiales bacterium]